MAYSPASEPPRHGLTSIENRFGSTLLSVTYLTGATEWRVSSIKLNPGTAQERTVSYTWGTFTVAGVTWQVLSSIAFPTAGGTLTVTFARTGTGIARNWYDNSTELFLCNNGDSALVPLLASMILSGGSASQAYAFGYYVLPEPPDVEYLGGALTSISLPTGGAIQYQYGSIGGTCFGTGCEDPETGLVSISQGPQEERPDYTRYWDVSAAVIQRTETDPYTGLASTVTYDRYQHVPLVGEQTQDDQVTRRTIVRAPSGNPSGSVVATRYVFHTEVDPALNGGGIEIARRYYAGETADVGTIRSIINCHEGSGGSQPVCGYRTPSGHIQRYGFTGDVRLQATITWYGENPTGGETCSSSQPIRCTASTHTEYVPGAHKYKQTRVHSTLTSMPGWAERIARTEWSPNTGNWLLDLYTSKTITDAGSPVPSSVATTFTFDQTTGFLQQIVTADGSNGTLTSTFGNPDSRGSPQSETVSGSGGLTGEFTDRRTYQTGLVLSTQRDGIAWKSFDVDRDPSTGLITTARDPNAALAAVYEYDALGRITKITPPGETPTRICYQNAGANSSLAIVKKSSGDPCITNDGAPGVGSGAVEAYQYDGHGRPVRAIRRLPNSQSTGSHFARQETRYDAAGHVAYRTEWHPCPSGGTDLNGCIALPFDADASPGTRWTNFDPFGRAQQITRADGSVTAVSFVDGELGITHSDTLQSTTVTIAGSPATTISRTDPLGRIITITEPIVGGSADQTTYTYNALGKVATVWQPQTPPAPTQERAFTYDRFGFLRSETHPENGTTAYGSYDVHGNPLSKAEGGVTHAFAYDLVGRLTSQSAAGVTYLSNCYDGLAPCAGTGGNYPLGKLVQRIGYNPRSPRAPSVTQAFRYDTAIGGRLTQRTTTLAGIPQSVLPITETWAYNSLGLVDTYGLPVLSLAPDVAAVLVYKSGRPTGLTGGGVTVVSDARYNPAGGLASWLAGNDVLTTITQDPSLLPRPLNIGSSSWPGTGNYAYDAAGNITSIGSDTFSYDARSRLKDATISGIPQSFAYDRFGNLLTGGIDQSSNRLIAGAYDQRGSMLTNASQNYKYDELNRQVSFNGGTERYLYDGAGERIARVTSSLPALSLWTIDPCRAVDSRTGLGMPSSQPAQLSPFVPLDLQIVGGVCPIPSTAEAVVGNLTVVPGGLGHASLRASGTSSTTASTINFGAGQVRANSFQVGLSTTGGLTITSSVTADAIIDAVGYLAYAGSASNETWYLTLRNDANQLSTEYTVPAAGSVTRTKSYFYLGNLLVATRDGNGNYLYYASDHLGTPRHVTGPGGVPAEPEHKYFAYGGEVTGGFGNQPLKFAGMERDQISDNDYNHARFQSSLLGRFLSPDRVGGRERDPQSWNRYAYARSNPLKYLDPNGESWLVFNRTHQTLTLFSGTGKNLGMFPAANRTAPGTRGPIEVGRYTFKDTRSPRFHGSERDRRGLPKDSASGAYGIHGIFRLHTYTDSKGVERVAVGVHGGRENATDPKGGTDYRYWTEGCIRTCEYAMGLIRDVAELDPLEYLDVVDEEPQGDEAAAGLSDPTIYWPWAADRELQSVYGEGYLRLMQFLNLRR